MVQTITEQDRVLNLKASGFGGTLIQEFLSCWEAEKTMEPLRLLSQK